MNKYEGVLVKGVERYGWVRSGCRSEGNAVRQRISNGNYGNIFSTQGDEADIRYR